LITGTGMAIDKAVYFFISSSLRIITPMSPD